MPDVFLYAGEVNPADVVLSDPTVARAGGTAHQASAAVNAASAVAVAALLIYAGSTGSAAQSSVAVAASVGYAASASIAAASTVSVSPDPIPDAVVVGPTGATPRSSAPAGQAAFARRMFRGGR